MNTAYLIGFPLLLIAALELFLGLLLLRKNPRNSPVNSTTAATAFFAALWSFSAGLMYIQFARGLDHIFFARMSWVGWFTVPAALQTILFLGDEQSAKARLVGKVLYPYWAVVLGLCLFTDLIVRRGYIPLPFRNSPGPLEMPARLIGSMMAFWLIFEIIRLRRRTRGFRRSQLGYYLSGTVVFGIGGAVIGGLIQLFTGTGIEPSLSAYFSLPWLLTIFYAITRYRLFDIRLVLSRTIAVLLLSFGVSALQFLFFRLMEPIVGGIASIFISVPIIGVLFFGTPLSGSVQRWINDLVLGDRYLYQKMLRQSANAMITILDHDELLRYVVESVRTFLGVRETSLYVRAVDGTFSKSRSGTAAGAGDALPPVIARHLASRNSPIVVDDLPSGSSAWTKDLRESVLRIGAEVVLPLVSKGQLLGVLTLGQRTEAAPYLPSDIETLQVLANHAAVSIENARLFEEAGRVRASLKESEDIFSALAETMSAAILILRSNRLLYVNKAATSFTGYSRNELLANDPWSLIHPDYRAVMMERARSLMKGEQISPQFEFKYIAKGGSEGWAITTSAVIEMKGTPALLTTMVDVTDIKKAEEDRARLQEEKEKYLRERIAEQERFTEVLDTTNEGFWICGEDVRFTYVNDAYCRMLGYGREELLSMSIKDVELTEGPEAVDDRTRTIKAQGYDEFETRHRRKDGSAVDLDVTVTLSRTGDRFFSFGRDIKDRKKAEAEKAKLTELNMRYLEERLAEQERFSAILQATSEGFWIVNDDFRLVFVNDAYCRMSGYTRAELLTMSIADLEASEDPEAVRLHTENIQRMGADRFETQHRRKDGALLDLEVTVNRFKDEKTLFSFLRDISDRKKAEAEKVRYQAEREKILKDLHDGIGGLTTNINLLAEIAQTRDDMGDVRRSLATIADLSRESLSEIRNFLQSLDVKDLTWQTVAAELRHLGSAIVESHDIRFSLTTSLPEQAGGPSSMMAMNLYRIYKESLANIVKHSHASAVEVSLGLQNSTLMLSVHDDGVGVGEQRGSGRGLINMRTRAEELGGRLAITTDKGTTVLLSIPVSKPATA